MNERLMIERHLAQAEKRVGLGESHLARQKEIFAELERDEHEEAAQATCELTQRSHVEDETALNWQH